MRSIAMGTLALLAASILVAPSSALDAAAGTPAAQSPAKDEFEQVRADLRKAFETARPVSPQLRQTLTQLAEKPAAPGAAPEETAGRQEEADELQGALEEVLALQKGPSLPPAADQKGGVGPDKKMSSDLAKRVGKVCDIVRVDEEPRRVAALDLYLSRWQSGRADLTPEKAVEERKLAQENLKKSMSAQTGSQGRANARLRDLAAFRSGAGPGSVGPSVAATTIGAGAVPASASGALVGPQSVRAGVVPDLASNAPKPQDPQTEACSNSGGLQTVAKLVNMEKCSNKGTLNRESKEGTQSRICELMQSANFNPHEAWSKSLAARNKSGADPGDLDLRNAEHYLYAYSTASKPQTWGDTAPVQALMAVGWTPFKTITKYWRPTSKPSWDEMEWGVKGAYHGASDPDWRRQCAAKTAI
ncbi:MAG: hypothetical protein A2V88_12690 [Elusimicrobia bacterium RBG_16_66_12]|nr:MAG: hypothetical protein A2V88_12690 [Elusimicrobia bacterium RBG_16_66_12]